jgi:hypothetical protein
MNKDGLFVEEVLAIQAPMLEAGRPHFSESELDDLRVLIRLAVEFSHHLDEHAMSPLDTSELRYLGESIFSGVDSFCAVSIAYGVMSGGTKSTLHRDGTWVASLKQEFDARFHDFLIEPSFEERCRLVLDLFKLQIVFAGLSYD